MSRLIFWVALICLIVFAIRSKIRGAQRRAEQQFRAAQQRQQMQQAMEQPRQQPHQQSAHRQRAGGQAASEAETMLACAHCGVFFPASEAVRFDGAIYCSKAHAALPPN
ncbi:hypothetical protein ASF61_01470 [Duganella sp. Leaf126]|uniref:PP0621 family protein n=1 Tax=Duganella sp. Leaf126 TaxID=1736266 RepID=UPI0006F994EA|nr:PP0621 family protein [Duganella sp. Leaf126]KQQ47757.1 hypothetical protein ASF61_01470 [Duganella sp. Leaf126]